MQFKCKVLNPLDSARSLHIVNNNLNSTLLSKSVLFSMAVNHMNSSSPNTTHVLGVGSKLLCTESVESNVDRKRYFQKLTNIQASQQIHPRYCKASGTMSEKREIRETISRDICIYHRPSSSSTNFPTGSSKLVCGDIYFTPPPSLRSIDCTKYDSVVASILPPTPARVGMMPPQA